MADDKTKTGKQDRDRISMSEDYEVKDWCDKFGVDPEQLASAIKEVGNKASDVEAFLKSGRRK